MLKYVLFLVQLLFFQVGITQKIFNSGTVELVTGEQVEVLILQDSYKNYANSITYKEGKNEGLQTKSPNEIKSFSIKKQNIKFHSFEITDRYLVAPNVYKYKNKIVFMKQLEEGEVSLFEFKDDEGRSWMYIQKEGGIPDRLEAIKKEYNAINKSEMIRIDTVTTTKHIRGGFFKTEKPYLSAFSETFSDCKSVQIDGSLELHRKLVLDMVRTYNDNCKKGGKSYFIGQSEFRLYLLGGYYPADNLRKIFIPTMNLEAEFLLNLVNNNISFSIGAFGRGKLKAENNSLTSTDIDVKFRQFYLRSNFYASQRNRFKPFGYIGLKVTGYGNNGNNINGLWDSDGIIGIGAGFLYEFLEHGVVRLEIGNRPFPDIKLGLGLRL